MLHKHLPSYLQTSLSLILPAPCCFVACFFSFFCVKLKVLSRRGSDNCKMSIFRFIHFPRGGQTNAHSFSNATQNQTSSGSDYANSNSIGGKRLALIIFMRLWWLLQMFISSSTSVGKWGWPLKSARYARVDQHRLMEVKHSLACLFIDAALWLNPLHSCWFAWCWAVHTAWGSWKKQPKQNKQTNNKNLDVYVKVYEKIH